MKLKKKFKYIITGDMPIALPVIFLYRLFLLSILTRLWFTTAEVTLHISGYSYITMNNFVPFLLHPVTWIFLTFWLILLSFVSLLEQGFLIFSYSRTAQHLEFRFSDLFSCLIDMARHPVQRNMTGMALYSFLLEVLAAGACAPFLVKKIRSFFSVLNFVFASNVGMVLFATGLFLLLYAAACRLFIVNFFVLEGSSTHECAVENAALIRRNGKRQTIITFAILLLMTGFMIVLYAAVTFIVVAGMRIFMSPERVLAGYMQFSDRFNYFFIVVYDTVSIYIFERIGVKRFYRLKEKLDGLTSTEKMRGYQIETNKVMRAVSYVAAAVVVIITIFSGINIIYNGINDIGGVNSKCAFSAHKGQSADAPENTIPAFIKAVYATADFNEIDVHMTADNKLVVIHDPSLRRTCGVNKQIIDCKLAYIKSLDAGRWYSNQYAGTRVPTLNETMDACKGRISLDIDVKPVNDNDEKIAAAVVKEIRENDYENQCVITSMSRRVLKCVKRLDPAIKTGYILNMASGSFYDMGGVDFFSMKYTTITSNAVKGAHSKGREIWAWTVDDKDDLLKMQSMGVDNVITDNVIYARDIYSEKFDSHSVIGIVSMALTH